MSVAFSELAGSPHEEYTLGGFQATREILVAWSARDAMARELLGDTIAFAGETVAQYPRRSDVVVANIAVDPWEEVPDGGTFTDITSDLNGYTGQKAKLTIQYAWLPPGTYPNPRDFTIEPQTFVSYRRTIGGEYIKLGGRALVWASDPNGAPPAVDAVATVRVPITEHHFTWHRVNNPPETQISNLMGRVNATEFFGYAAETLLFEGATMDREFQGFPENDPVGGGAEASWTTWKVDYTFREKKITGQRVDDGRDGEFAAWNHTWRDDREPNDAGFDRLVPYFQQDGGIYATGDFSLLFQYE